MLFCCCTAVFIRRLKLHFGGINSELVPWMYCLMQAIIGLWVMIFWSVDQRIIHPLLIASVLHHKKCSKDSVVVLQMGKRLSLLCIFSFFCPIFSHPCSSFCIKGILWKVRHINEVSSALQLTLLNVSLSHFFFHFMYMMSFRMVASLSIVFRMLVVTGFCKIVRTGPPWGNKMWGSTLVCCMTTFLPSCPLRCLILFPGVSLIGVLWSITRCPWPQTWKWCGLTDDIVCILVSRSEPFWMGFPLNWFCQWLFCYRWWLCRLLTVWSCIFVPNFL